MHDSESSTTTPPTGGRPNDAASPATPTADRDAQTPGTAPGADASASTTVATQERGLLHRSPRLTVALIAGFVTVVVIALWLVLFYQRDSPDLRGERMQLQLTYPISAAPTALLVGGVEAAPANAEITCRMTDGLAIVGTATADDAGAFVVDLDADAWPQSELSGDTFNAANGTIECHAAGGAWVSPLQPPRISIA